MSKLIGGVEHYTAKEITELCGVTASAFNNTVYRHSLARVMHEKHWYYPQSSLDAYRRMCTKNTAPLQSQSEPAQLPPAALQSLDPLESEEDLERIEASDMSEVQPEISPEIALLHMLKEQLRRQVASEEQEKVSETP